ncbi:MAG: hypothetical protein NZM15_08940 [Flavobacteriales bacterium]|nr:hypothetical protein [Flavobacteriales bacterium]MDW8432814.1 hypothetical protein [Flavobacteriales bacterium]
MLWRGLFYNLLWSTAFLLPFNPAWIGILAAITSVFWLAAWVSGQVAPRLGTGTTVVSLVYAAYLSGMYLFVYKDVPGLAKTFETRAGFWLGLIFVWGIRWPHEKLLSLYRALRTGLDLSLSLCLLTGIGRSLWYGNLEKLVYSDLSLFMHPGYLAALVFLMWRMEIFLNSGTLWRQALYVGMLLLLATKAVWGAWLCSVVVGFFLKDPAFIRFRFTTFQKLLGLSLLIFASFLLLPRLSETWGEMQGLWPEKKYNSSLLVRFNIWEVGLKLLPKAGLTGLGETALRQRLLLEYSEKNLDVPFKHQYNLHNQFLEEWLLHGLLGCCLWVLVMMGVVPVGKTTPSLWLAWLFLFLCWGFSESFLQRSLGCLWAGFVWPLLTCLSKKYRSEA